MLQAANDTVPIMGDHQITNWSSQSNRLDGRWPLDGHLEPIRVQDDGQAWKIETQVDAEETKVNPCCLELFQNKKKGADPQ